MYMENETNKIDQILEEIQDIKRTMATKEYVKEVVEENVGDVLEVVNFIKDNAVTRDGFQALDQKASGLVVSISSIQVELDQIKASLKRLEQKTQEDDVASIAEIVKLKRRIKVIERRISQFLPAYH